MGLGAEHTTVTPRSPISDGPLSVGDGLFLPHVPGECSLPKPGGGVLRFPADPCSPPGVLKRIQEPPMMFEREGGVLNSTLGTSGVASKQGQTGTSPQPVYASARSRGLRGPPRHVGTNLCLQSSPSLKTPCSSSGGGLGPGLPWGVCLHSFPSVLQAPSPPGPGLSSSLRGQPRG